MPSPKGRLSKAKAEAIKHGLKPQSRAADLLARLEDAHAFLKTRFHFAGATTKLLLEHCKQSADDWKSLEEIEKQ